MSITSVVDNYEEVIDFMTEQSRARSDYGTKWDGFQIQLTTFPIFIALKCLEVVFGRLKSTAASIKSPKLTKADIGELISTLVSTLKSCRDDKFDNFWVDVTTSSDRQPQLTTTAS